MSLPPFVEFDRMTDLRDPPEPIEPDWDRISRLRVQRGSDWRPCILRLSAPDVTCQGPMVGVYRLEPGGFVRFISDHDAVMQDEEVKARVGSVVYPREEIQRIAHLECLPCTGIKNDPRGCNGLIHPDTGRCCECNSAVEDRVRRIAA